MAIVEKDRRGEFHQFLRAVVGSEQHVSKQIRRVESWHRALSEFKDNWSDNAITFERFARWVVTLFTEVKALEGLQCISSAVPLF